MLPKVIKAIANPNFTLHLQFDNKVWKEFSVTPYLHYPVFKPLENIAFFEKVEVKHNTIVWGKDEDIDFDPYTLWTESVEVNK